MWFSKRTVGVKLDNMKLISAYQPTKRAHREEVEEYRFELETQLSSSDREE